MRINKSLIVIPTYKEKRTIADLIDAINNNAATDLLIVDDNSPDTTPEIVEELQKKMPHLFMIKRAGKLGLGSAYVEGFRYAIANGYSYVLQMDGDFSHNPGDVGRFFAEIESCDMVVGSRYVNGVSVINWPLRRIILSYFANRYARLVTGLPIKDSTSGFNCIRVEVLKQIGLDRIKSNGYGFQIELKYHTWRENFRVREIPIIFIDRAKGVTKMSKKVIWEALWLVWRLALSYRIKKTFSK